jgi:signal recognition particle receptor subunit beta
MDSALASDGSPTPTAAPLTPPPPPSGPPAVPLPLGPEAYLRSTVSTAVKLLIVGPFAVGKTTFVATLSEIRPLRTEETVTQASETVDDLSGAEGKRTTTVALDFGRLTLNDNLVLYLFGAPGQQRFTNVWLDMTQGALGALVLADTRRLDQSYEVMGLLEEHGLAYAVAVNQFDGAPRYSDKEMREALDLLPETPLVVCDARERESSTRALIALVDHLYNRTHQEKTT